MKPEVHFGHCIKFIQPLETLSTLRGRQLLKRLPGVPGCLSVIVQERGMRKKKEMLHGVEVVCLGTE